MLNFNLALENLRTMNDFNFTNFLSDREMGFSTEGASYCCFRKAVSNNCFQKVLLITFISNCANLSQYFIFAHVIESWKAMKSVLYEMSRSLLHSYSGSKQLLWESLTDKFR